MLQGPIQQLLTGMFKITRKELLDLLTQGRSRLPRIIDAVDGSLLIGHPHAVPIGNVGRTVRTKVDGTGHQSLVKNMLINHFKRGSLGP